MLESIEEYKKARYNDACKKAFMAFESTLKIKSNSTKHTTFGKLIDEHANHIFFGVECQYLKYLNNKFRNKNAHGSGTISREINTENDASFVLSLCMAYIKRILLT